MDLEKQIAQQTQTAVQKAIHETLVAYNSPMRKLADRVVEENSDEIHGVMNKAFKSVIRTKAFEDTILEEFERKVAKMLVGQLSGQVEKAVSKIKQDPTLKAKMILAIEDIIEGGENKTCINAD